MAYPDCALALTFEGVSLRRRRGNGWIAQGQAFFDAPDTRTALERLRLRAGGPEAGARPPVLLVLPTDQVLYREMPPEEAGADGAAAVRAALEGTTPYALDALRFTFERREDGGIAYAAVALETLQEVERFARAQGFEPRGTMAAPLKDPQKTPAWFGLSAATAPDGWMGRPAEVDWAVAPEGAAPLGANPVQVAASRGRAQSAAKLLPPSPDVTLTEDLSADESARVQALIRGPSIWMRLRAQILRFFWLSAAAAAGLAAVVLWLERDPPAPDPDLALAPIVAPVPTPPDATPAPTEQPADEIDRAPTLDIDETDFWTPERGLMRGVETVDLDGLVQPAVDPPVGADALALALPDPRTTLPELALSAPPPAPEARFDIDEAGFVRPAPNGAATPEGHLVYEGTPPSSPAPRPGRVEEAVEAARALAEATPPEPQDAAEAPVRPRIRPDDLIAQFERRTFGGRTRSELATLRPVRRSAELQAAAAARQAIQGAEVGAALAAAEQTLSVVPGGDDPRPAQRPAAPPRQTAQAQAVAAVAAASTARVEAPAAPSPGTDAREVAASYTEPAQPTSAAVEKRATQSTRLDLRRVNLLGTFGPAQAQRALVRLPSGKVVDVKVGDRVDGGRVAAIGQGELRYEKGGKSHVLTMPRG